MTDLPRLCLVADGFAAGRPGLDALHVRGVAAELVAAGVGWVWMRDHHADAAAFDVQARRFAERLREIAPDVTLSVGGRLATARAVGAFFHAGRRGDALEDAAAVGVRAGFSAHSVQGAIDAERAGAAYATLSPIFPTATHPDAPPLGLGAVGEARAAGLPVLALGGLTPDRTRAARAAGASGVAVLSDLLLAPRPVWRLDQYARALGL